MIDQKVLAGFQWLVDESERQPSWWAEHAAWAGMAFGLVAYILASGNDVKLYWIGALFIVGALNIYACRVPSLLSAVGSGWYARVLLGALLAIRIFSFVVAPENWRAAYIANDALLLALLYFAACQPPRPRKRRQTVPQGGAA